MKRTTTRMETCSLMSYIWVFFMLESVLVKSHETHKESEWKTCLKYHLTLKMNCPEGKLMLFIEFFVYWWRKVFSHKSGFNTTWLQRWDKEKQMKQLLIDSANHCSPPVYYTRSSTAAEKWLPCFSAATMELNSILSLGLQTIYASVLTTMLLLTSCFMSKLKKQVVLFTVNNAAVLLNSPKLISNHTQLNYNQESLDTAVCKQWYTLKSLFGIITWTLIFP